MWNKIRFPIRWKVLVTLLFVVTFVVSIITFTMARMFHDDKTTYIHDLSSIVALNSAEESKSLLMGYSEFLATYARIMNTEGLGREARERMLQGLFGDFPDLIAIALFQGGEELAAAYDSRALEAAGLSKEAVQEFRRAQPLAMEQILAGKTFIRHAALADTLPAFTVALAHVPDEGEAMVVSALLRLDGIQRIAEHSDVFDVFLVDSEGILLAHSSSELQGSQADQELLALFDGLTSLFSVAMTREDVSHGTEMVGGFANVEMGGLRAGAQIPRSAAFLASRDLLRNLIFVALALLLLATAMSLFWSGRITKSMERLSLATREIARGVFDVQVEVTSKDEIGTLATSFNTMTTELQEREEKLEKAQSQLVQSEKMAAFGQLGAGIAHEVKNPLAGILGCAQLSLRKAKEGTPLYTNLLLIEKETKRCKEIIENLMKFARQEKAVFSQIDLTTVVEDAMAIVRHQLEMKSIKLDSDLCEFIPPAFGNANQLQQVLVNLIMNAQQAMEENGGSILVSTALLDSDRVEIRVSDTGPGISPDVKKQIFEPFFTTKPGGKGTGLGLSVSFGIIQDHQGHVDVQSQPGEGTTFIINVPLHQEDQPEPEPEPEQETTPREEDEKPRVEIGGAGH